MVAAATRSVPVRVTSIPVAARSRFVLGSLARWLSLAALERAGHPLESARATYAGARPSDRDAARTDQPEGSSGRSPYYPLNMVHASEPRIDVVARALASLLRLVEITDAEGVALEPDGFHLRHLLAWRARMRPHDMEPIEHYLATGLCNVNCEFCYEHGTPPEMRTPRFRVRRAELDTRLRYYDAARGLALFDMFHQYYDAFAHPDALAVLARLRKQSAGVLDLITNGRRLTADVVEALDALRPLQLTISLNSQDPSIRARVMRDRTPDVAARSLPLLHQAGIPFGIVVVPWPPEIDAAELEKTIRFAEAWEPLFVSVSLPGFTKWFPNPPAELTETYHRRILATVRALRPQMSAALLVQPRMAEAVLHGEDHTRPFVLGTLPRSPARAAALCYGDALDAVNGFPTPFGWHASRLIQLSDLSGARRLLLTVRHGDATREVELTRRQPDPVGGWGLLLADGLDPALFRRLAEDVAAAGDEDVWLLSSRWMAGAVERMLRRVVGDEAWPARFSVIPVDNRYFGGNIALGDLLTVADFAHVIEERLLREGRPDRVVIPGSAFTRWGRDLRGRSLQRLRRRFDVPITVIDNHRIMI